MSATLASDLWSLKDQRDFLVASLADSKREHDAGDLSDVDYEVLRRRDEARLANVLEQLEQAGDSNVSDGATLPDEPDGIRATRRGHKKVLLTAGVAAVILAGSLLLVAHLSSRRLPGQVLSGSIDVNSSQQIERELAQAATLVERGKIPAALTLYHRVLSSDPTQPVALSELGWIEYQAGVEGKDRSVVSDGRSLVEKATQVSPSFAEAHLFLALIDYEQDHETSSALDEISMFLADHPSSTEIAGALPELKSIYASADLPLPPSVTAVGGSAQARRGVGG